MSRRASLAVLLGAGVLVASSVAAPVLTNASATPSSATWPYPNGNLANTRVAVGSTISASNVTSLKKAWSYTLKGDAAKSVSGLGTLSSNPIIVNGLVYVQDLHCNVYALSLATGKLVWSYIINKKELSGPGPNGVAVVNGRVYGASPTVVFALNATTGKVVWTDKHLLKKGQGTFGIQPQASGGRLYIASQYGHVPGGGLLLGLNATTGKRIWTFKTVPKSTRGVASLGLGAGGAWETPLVGTDGSVSFGIGNPYQTLESGLTTSRITTCKRRPSLRPSTENPWLLVAARWELSTP
jgi:alcohol dehydrogenase (cytochrome c)